MENRQLDFGTIIRNGIDIGLKNAPQLIVNFLLFILTIWIPYINIGTFIAISAGIPLKLSKGESIDFTEIFDKKYRHEFGEYFLQVALKSIGVNFATALMVIPGIILSLQWMLSEMLFLDGRTQMGFESYRASNKYTKGNLWAIFLAYVGFFIGIGVASWVLGQISDTLAGLFTFVATLAAMPIVMGMGASIYRDLVLEEDGVANEGEDVEKVDVEDF